MMSEYRLATADQNGPVIRTADGASIPADPANRDWQEYQKWLEAGGVPDPYVPPPEPEPVPPPPELSDAVLYDHENRLRALEGTTPLSRDKFMRKLRG
jgi:hypothetical protein